jgi:tetratricopeptide (TPR) repeat protein
MGIRIIAAAIIWTMGAVAAHADWVEARSENFIFVGKTSEKKAKTILRELEEYRTIIFKVLGIDVIPEMVPVRIYGVKSSNTIEKMTGQIRAAGVYRTTYEGPVFILDISGDFSKNSDARQIAYHEYTHHLVATYSNTVYPRWFDEGFADYLSTFEVDENGAAKVGLPQKDRVYSMAHHGWMDMKTFLGAIRRYPYENVKSRQRSIDQSRFYAQSWLTVHYINSTPEYRDKLDAYLEAIAQTSVSSTVFEDTFGITPEDFSDVLLKYLKKNQYLYRTITLSENDRNAQVQSRKLSKSEAYFHRGEAVRHFRNDEAGQKRGEKYYQKAATTNNVLLAQIEASRAIIAIELGDEETALKNINLALDRKTGDSRVLRIAGHVYLDLYVNKETPSNMGQIKKARTFLKRAMRANPRNITAHFDYVSTYSATSDNVSKQALYSALECAGYYKSRNFVDSNINVAMVLMRKDRHAEAQALLEKAVMWSRSSENRIYAKQLLKQLN